MKDFIRPDRTVSRPSYSAILDITKAYGSEQQAYAIVKQTFRVEGGRLVPAEPERLLNDLQDPELDPKLPTGSDYWPHKTLTDVVVQGSAYTPNASPVRTLEVGVSVGSFAKKARVFGTRAVEWGVAGTPHVGDPEPFEEMPLTRENAYGGIDWRVPFEHEDFEDDPMVAAMVAENDHPGLYPRNPFGKGYLVQGGPVPEMRMPTVEDPGDLLNADRLIVGDPALWWQQPLPWTFDWTNPGTFPRYVWLAPQADAWFPAPEDGRLPEVSRGFLPAGYRTVMDNPEREVGPEPEFAQGASHGLQFKNLEPGTPLRIWGMSPGGKEVTFSLPQAPSIAFNLEGRREDPSVRLHSVVCRPAEGTVSLVYGATAELHRVFVPFVHKRIPIAVSFNRDEPIPYLAPPTVRDMMAQVSNRQAAGGM